jgi:hypothetical protein
MTPQNSENEGIATDPSMSSKTLSTCEPYPFDTLLVDD